MSDNTLILKKLKVLLNKKIWVSNDVNVYTLYHSDKLKLIKGTVKDYPKFIELTDDYLKQRREVFTGRTDKSYTNNWITYHKCKTIQLCFDGTLPKLSIQVFDGDFSGNPEKLRWEGEFELNSDCLNLFEMYIESSFNDEIDYRFIIEEEKRIENRKKAIRKKLLSE